MSGDAEPAPAVSAPPPPCVLHGLVERQARRRGDRPAVVDGGRSLTFAELDRRADDLAVTCGAWA